MLIRNAEIDGRSTDVLIGAGVVQAIARHIAASAVDVIDAQGAALLPGLHDHHLHLSALAAARASLQCGPPQVHSADELRACLRAGAVQLAPGGWIRGIGYHEAVAGDIDRDWLDRVVPELPVRIQHRGGRLWIFNSPALRQLDPAGPLETIDGRLSGRLYDADTWLRGQLGSAPPCLRAASALLAGFGVTGITEVTPHNTIATYRHFAAAQQRGELLQALRVMGDASLDAAVDADGIKRGELKIHLHEGHLPTFEALCAAIAASHAAARAVAIHCVTLTELVFSLGALTQAGCRRGDRIEHAAVTPPELLAQIRALGLTVVTQPHFIRERGDNYLRDVDAADRPWLYRLRAFLDAGVPLAAGTDAPFGAADPWRAMQAAVTRRTESGAVIGADEALTPEQALALFTGADSAPGAASRRIEVGARADLCLLDRPWRQARENLEAVQVRATIRAGQVIFVRD